MRTRLAVLAGLLVVVTATLGDTAKADQSGEITRNVHLREGPSTETRSLGVLKPPDVVVLLEPSQTDRFYHVITEGLQEGYVWAAFVRVRPIETHTTGHRLTANSRLARHCPEQAPEPDESFIPGERSSPLDLLAQGLTFDVLHDDEGGLRGFVDGSIISNHDVRVQ